MAAYIICCRIIEFVYLLKYWNPIATDKLNIDKLKSYFKNVKSFETKDIVAFYERDESEITQTTVNWRVYSLVKMGLLNRIGRGKFIIGKTKSFIPEISPKMKADIFTVAS